MNAIEKLKRGFKDFRAGEFKHKAAMWEDLVEKGQNPSVAVVACSDSRIDPAMMLNTEPGDIFFIRNVANLVPPYDDAGGYHGTSAALEYAVQHLSVEHIIVLGHAYCGGIGSLFGPPKEGQEGYSFISPWMSIVEPAHRRIIATMPEAGEPEQMRACEQAAVLVSLENLMTFTHIRERVSEGKLRLHGWFVDIRAGTLNCYNSETNRFEMAD